MARSMAQAGPTLSSPRWAGDYLDRNALLPGGAKLDAVQFLAEDAVVVTVGAAGAAANATSVPVDALSGPLPSGTLLDFGGKKFARLSAAAAAAATSLAVDALATALVDNDTATYAGTGSTHVPSGTVVGRTITERDASEGFGPADAADDEIYIVALEVTDVTALDDVELYRHGRVVKENFLPGWSSLASGVQDAVRAAYACTRGAD